VSYYDNMLVNSPLYETVGSVDDAGSYEFNTLLVLQNKKTKQVFYAQDSGCSCPVPFEGFQSEADLTRVTLRSYDAFVRAVEGYNVSRSEKDALQAKVYRLLRGGAE
jgi:hypothetical protein